MDRWSKRAWKILPGGVKGDGPGSSIRFTYDRIRCDAKNDQAEKDNMAGR